MYKQTNRFTQVSGTILLGVLAILGLMYAFGTGLASNADAANMHQAEGAASSTFTSTLNYQGVLRDAQGGLVNGERVITVRIYDEVMNGEELHGEVISTFVRDGVFNVVLGDEVPISSTVFASSPRFIGITVAPDTDEMVPRQRLHPVPWAQLANHADAANTLIPNAIINSGATIDDGSLLNFNNGNWKWSIHAGPDGWLRFTERNNDFARLGIKHDGSVSVPGDFFTRKIIFNNGSGISFIDTAVQILNPLVVNGVVTVNGDINAVGRVKADGGFNGRCLDPGQNFNSGTCNQDVAETFGTDERIGPGNLVVFIPEDREFPAVQRSTQPYQGAIVGVVSTDPGLVFDQGETRLSGDNTDLITDEKTAVAMVGRVPTKFSLENGPIVVGDPLTSSSTPGAAMKATEAGQIIGYAMQSSQAAEDGKILVWLQLSSYIPADTLAALNQMGDGYSMVINSPADTAAASLEAQIATLSAQVEALSVEASSKEDSNAQWPWRLSLAGSFLMVGLVFSARKRFGEAL